MMSRVRFDFDDTGRAGDTGGPLFGVIRQIRWSADSSDTGCDLEITMLPVSDDSGDGWLAYSRANALAADFIVDTGLSGIFAAGERLRARVVNQTGVGTATRGRLYVWLDATR